MQSELWRTITYFTYSFFSVPFFISRDIEQVWVWLWNKKKIDEFRRDNDPPRENKRKLFGTNFCGGIKYCKHPGKMEKNIQNISLI